MGELRVFSLGFIFRVQRGAERIECWHGGFAGVWRRFGNGGERVILGCIKRGIFRRVGRVVECIHGGGTSPAAS